MHRADRKVVSGSISAGHRDGMGINNGRLMMMIVIILVMIMMILNFLISYKNNNDDDDNFTKTSPRQCTFVMYIFDYQTKAG